MALTPFIARWHSFGWLGVALFITALVFANSLGNGFVDWDDTPFLINNPHIKAFGPRALWHIFTLDMSVYRPLVYSLYSFIYWAWGLNPFPYHLASYLFHLANVALVFALARKLGFGVSAATFAALAFGIHPTRTESVAWVLALTDPFYVFFYLSALWFYLQYVQAKAKYSYWLALFAFGLSLLAKPAAVTFPLLLFLVDYQQYTTSRIRVFLEKTPFLLGACAMAYLTLQLGANARDYNVRPVYGMFDRVWLAGYSFYHYAKVMICPTNLAFLYALPLKKMGWLPTIYYASSFFLLAWWGLMGYFWQKNWRNLLFCVAFFVVHLLPVLHLVSFGDSVVNDRYTYLAAVGVFLAVGLGAGHLARHAPRWRWAVWGALAALVAWWAGLTVRANRAWASGEAHYRAAMASQPLAAPHPYYYLAELLGRSGRASSAERLALYDRAVAIYPIFVQAHLARAKLLTEQGRLPEADSALVLARRLRPDHPLAHLYSGNLRAHEGDYPAALRAYHRAWALDQPHCYFPQVYVARAKAYLALGRADSACADLREAARWGLPAADSLCRVHCPPG
jgi:protein O-mannosyl-transferase